MAKLVPAVVLLMTSATPALAEGPADSADKLPTMEAGLFGGGFISNTHHQFYDIMLWPGFTRPEIDRVSPELGFRLAYFFGRHLGVEAELSMITTNTIEVPGTAKIFNLRLQGIFQYPISPRLLPFVAAGWGPMYVTSDVLGKDADYPIHIGAGIRFYVTAAIAIRADVRVLRGPSQQDPYTLNATYGELGLGVSFTPRSSPKRIATKEIEVDSDGDGIPDSRDKCPHEPEDKDLFQDDDGCPDPDNDGDGIPDGQDKCPLDPEDKDGYQDADGCPDLDNDGDGIPDAKDKCPNEPEDKDGFQDTDGCPDLDNDNDGIPDAQDKCPNEPETINGIQDDDGCPDRGDSLVILSPDRLELLESIQFTKEQLGKNATNLLGQIGATLRAHPEILRLRITVHVQPSKNADKDQALSSARASAIRDWLTNYGIAPQRLEPRGFGGSKPLVPASQKGSAAINERIDLIILERK